MSSKEKKFLVASLTVVCVSFLVIPVMTEIQYYAGTFPSAEHVSFTDLSLAVFYAHAVTYYDIFYLPGWYVGYSLHLPNLSHDLTGYLDSLSSQVSFASVSSSPVFGYLEAPPWDAVYVIPAMYVPLLLIIPIWILSKTIPTWRRVLYTYLIVTQISVILRLVLFLILIEAQINR